MQCDFAELFRRETEGHFVRWVDPVSGRLTFTSGTNAFLVRSAWPEDPGHPKLPDGSFNLDHPGRFMVTLCLYKLDEDPGLTARELATRELATRFPAPKICVLEGGKRLKQANG